MQQRTIIFIFAGSAWGLLAACAADIDSELTEPTVDDAIPYAQARLELDTPDDGFQLETRGAMVEPFDEAEWCEVVTVPGSPDERWMIDRIEMANTPFIHHFFIMAAEPGSESEQVMDEGMRVRCSGGVHGVFGTSLEPVLISGLATQHDRAEATMPEGVAIYLQGGQKLAVNYHFLNTSSEPVSAKQVFNFHRAKQQGELAQLRYFTFNNADLRIPAYGTYATQMARGFSQDVYVSLVARHTHDLGREFNVWWYEGPRDGELVFTSYDVESDALHPFDEPVLIPQGEGFRFECNFVNNTDRAVGVGPRASDEMCLLLGAWWPANPDEPAKSQTFYQF